MDLSRTAPVGIEEALQELVFDREAGVFRRLYERGQMPAGALAGHMLQEGLWIEAAGCHLLAHELAWYVFYGTWPPVKVEHLNGNLADNRSSNLRLRGGHHGERRKGVR